MDLPEQKSVFVKVFAEKINPEYLCEGDMVLSAQQVFRVTEHTVRDYCHTCGGKACTKVKFSPFAIVHYSRTEGLVERISF